MFRVLSCLITVSVMFGMFTVQAVRVGNLIPGSIITLSHFGVDSDNVIVYFKNIVGGIQTIRLGYGCYMDSQDWDMTDVTVVTITIDGNDHMFDRLTHKTEITVTVGLEGEIITHRKDTDNEF